MLLIVLRAWRITLIDSRRAASLRRMSPQTGLSGELVVLDGEGKARCGMRYPVIREGMIGSSRRADIRIRHPSIRRRHAWFQLTEGGLSVHARTGAPMQRGDGMPVRSLTLADGGLFTLGDIELLLVLTDAPPALRRGWDYDDAGGAGDARFPTPDSRETEAPDPDDLFLSQPVLRRSAQRGEPDGSPDDREENW